MSHRLFQRWNAQNLIKISPNIKVRSLITLATINRSVSLVCMDFHKNSSIFRHPLKISNFQWVAYDFYSTWNALCSCFASLFFCIDLIHIIWIFIIDLFLLKRQRQYTTIFFFVVIITEKTLDWSQFERNRFQRWMAFCGSSEFFSFSLAFWQRENWHAMNNYN